MYLPVFRHFKKSLIKIDEFTRNETGQHPIINYMEPAENIEEEKIFFNEKVKPFLFKQTRQEWDFDQLSSSQLYCIRKILYYEGRMQDYADM